MAVAGKVKKKIIMNKINFTVIFFCTFLLLL